MIHVAYIHLPVEDIFKVKVDESEIGFTFHRAVDKIGRFAITKPDGDLIKLMPHSREAAACLAAYLQYEGEGRELDAEGEDDGGS